MIYSTLKKKVAESARIKLWWPSEDMIKRRRQVFAIQYVSIFLPLLLIFGYLIIYHPNTNQILWLMLITEWFWFLEACLTILVIWKDIQSRWAALVNSLIVFLIFVAFYYSGQFPEITTNISLWVIFLGAVLAGLSIIALSVRNVYGSTYWLVKFYAQKVLKRFNVQILTIEELSAKIENEIWSSLNDPLLVYSESRVDRKDIASKESQHLIFSIIVTIIFVVAGQTIWSVLKYSAHYLSQVFLWKEAHLTIVLFFTALLLVLWLFKVIFFPLMIMEEKLINNILDEILFERLKNQITSSATTAVIGHIWAPSVQQQPVLSSPAS